MASSGGQSDRFIVGIDFGTTFSGVAFTYAGSPESEEEIEVVKNWPGSNNITSEKVPSELSYEPTAQGTKRNASGEPVNNVNPNRSNIKWGLELKPDQPRLRCLKLRLDSRQKLPSYVSSQDLDNQLRQYGKTTEEAISDYLTAVYGHAKEALIKRFGQQMVSTTKTDIVLTVPAVWSDAAKDATLRVAQKAGMGTDLRMVSEPEAAAIYALRSMGHQQRILNVRDNFIICDAGGGTVDLISYEIQSLSPLRLEESAPGTGALCGGVFLNFRFQELVKSRMGLDEFEDLCKRKPKSWAIALKYFEDYVKRNFDPMNSQTDYDDNKFNVPLPGAEDNVSAGIDCGFITLTTADVAELFRPLVNSVIDLIERQRNMLAAYGKAAKGVILVGGFGQSNYLYRCLKTRFADEDPPPTYTQREAYPASESESVRFLVLQPENPWTAVVRGAVLSNLEMKFVRSRKARRHYGVLCDEVWDRSKHSPENKYWDDLYDEWRAKNQISWHVTRGFTLPTGEPRKLNFRTAWRLSRNFPTSTSCYIVVSDAQHAPDEFRQSAETRILCKLDAGLQNVPRRLFSKRTVGGIQIRELDHDIGMTTDSGGLVFDLRIDDVVYGRVRATYE